MSIAPDVSHDELLERARALRPVFAEKTEETEQLTHIPEDLHEKLQEAGFYQLLTPRRFGGHEVDLPTYVKIWMEIARGRTSLSRNTVRLSNFPSPSVSSRTTTSLIGSVSPFASTSSM